MDLSYIEGITSELKYGYWFTFASFGIYFIWMTIVLFIHGKNEYYYILFGTISSILLMVIHYFIKNSSDAFISTLSFNSISYYYPFFVFGYICHIHKNLFEKLLENKYFLIAILFIAIIPIEWNKILSILIKACRVLLIFNLFYFYRNRLNKIYVNNTIGYIGKHTLEIYFLHFFLLFGLPNFSSYLNSVSEVSMPIVKGCTSFIEFFIIALLSVIIAVTSIIIRKIIDSIPIVSVMLFGPTKEKNHATKKVN